MKTFRTLPLALAGVVLAATVAGVAALANSNPGDPGGPAPSQRPSPTRPAAAPIRVDLANVEGRIVTVDILDRSGRVAGARSGAAGSGGSDGLRVTNLDARTLELEYTSSSSPRSVWARSPPASRRRTPMSC